MGMIESTHIMVESCKNDLFSIECGGPEYIGFDFYVREDEAIPMCELIAVTMDEFGVPINNITYYNGYSIDINDLDDEASIMCKIMEDSEYLKYESSKNDDKSHFKLFS